MSAQKVDLLAIVTFPATSIVASSFASLEVFDYTTPPSLAAEKYISSIVRGFVALADYVVIRLVDLALVIS